MLWTLIVLLSTVSFKIQPKSTLGVNKNILGKLIDPTSFTASCKNIVIKYNKRAAFYAYIHDNFTVSYQYKLFI